MEDDSPLSDPRRSVSNGLSAPESEEVVTANGRVTSLVVSGNPEFSEPGPRFDLAKRLMDVRLELLELAEEEAWGSGEDD